MIPIVLAPPRTGGSGSSQSSACVRPAAPVPNDSVRALAGAGRATPLATGEAPARYPADESFATTNAIVGSATTGAISMATERWSEPGVSRPTPSQLLPPAAALAVGLADAMAQRELALDKSVARTAATAHSKERKFLPTSAVPSWPGRRRSGDCGWLRARDPGSSSSRSRAEPVTRPWRSRRWHLVGSVPRPSRGSPCWGDRVPFCATCWTFGATPRLGLGVPAARPSLLRQLSGLAENCACEPWNGCFDLAGRHGPGFKLSSFHRKDNHAPRQPV